MGVTLTKWKDRGGGYTVIHELIPKREEKRKSKEGENPKRGINLHEDRGAWEETAQQTKMASPSPAHPLPSLRAR